jgi:hypothetical protein
MVLKQAERFIAGKVVVQNPSSMFCFDHFP